MPEASANVVSKPIRIQTASGTVETAILHIFEMQTAGAVPAAAAASAGSEGADMSSSDRRICALHQRSPIQMYMFDCHGALLSANKAALAGLRPDTGASCTMPWYSNLQQTCSLMAPTA
ncbi:TPA: hypothetical protein ACH3X3_013305, partial [Trebouxia sp. C0006]